MYSPLLIVHIIGGIAAVVSGMGSLFARKGGRFHRASGKVFVISMMFMAASGAYVAFTKSQMSNVIAGSYTFYLVSSAWWTLRRKEGERSLLDVALLALVLIEAAVFLGFGMRSAQRGRVYDAMLAYIVGSIGVLSAAGDVRVVVRGTLTRVQRMTRHVWRMGFALFVAAGSFFLGTASDPVLRQNGIRTRLFTKAVRATYLPDVPVLLIVILTIYWIIRVKFGSRTPMRAAEPGSPS